MRHAVLLSLCLSAISAPAFAQSCSVPSAYASIQQAVDDSSCATIAVAAGTFSENLYVWRPVTISGAGATSTIIDGQQAGSTVTIDNANGVTLKDLAVRNGAASLGGGIAAYSSTVTLDHVTVRDNVGYFWGGGVLNRFGTLIVVDSTITNNTMPYNDGAGIRNFGNLLISRSTLSNNSTSGFGGALATSGSVSISNSTITGNTGGYGGGIGNDGAVAIDFSTLTGNTSTVSAGGAVSSNGGDVRVHNSILAGNFWGATPSEYYNWIATPLTATGTNFASAPGSAGMTVVALGDLHLQPLAANGGPTATIALGAGSVAVDAASDCVAPGLPPVWPSAALATDQRGTTRPQGAACDVGAFEVAAVDQVVSLTAAVNALPLSPNDAAVLTDKLATAFQLIQSGNTTAAFGKIGAFANQVKAYVNSRRLSSAQGQALIDAANALKASL